MNREEEFQEFMKNTTFEDLQKQFQVPVIPNVPEALSRMYFVKFLLSNIDCSKCDAKCCKQFPKHYKQYIHIPETDLKEILNFLKIKEEAIEVKRRLEDKQMSLVRVKMPCPFLKDNKCSCYELRPQVCRTFPYNEFIEEGVFYTEPFCPQYTEAMYRVLFLTKKLKEAFKTLNDDEFKDLQKDLKIPDTDSLFKVAKEFKLL